MKKKKLLTIVSERTPAGGVGGSVSFTYEATSAEKEFALLKAIGAIRTVADHWGVTHKLHNAFEYVLKERASTSPDSGKE